MAPSPTSPSSTGAHLPGGPEPASPAPPASGGVTPAPTVAPAGSGRPGRLLRSRLAAITAGIAALTLLAAGWAGTGYRYDAYASEPPSLTGPVPSDPRGLAQLSARLKNRERELRARLKAAGPRGVYIVIDQTHNRLYLKKNDETLLEASCSAGSGMVLRETTGKKREWVFDTPRGHFRVLSRTENPVWRKPDWAFVEEGEAIPKNPADRLDYGSLGEYALYFGNGYMIHGTLYERLLGRAVSHGCIRVGRDDLRKVWANTTLGTHIYIY